MVFMWIITRVFHKKYMFLMRIVALFSIPRFAFMRNTTLCSKQVAFFHGGNNLYFQSNAFVFMRITRLCSITVVAVSFGLQTGA